MFRKSKEPKVPPVPVCQSCGIDMPTPEYLGTNADASPNQEYCGYCLRLGQFTLIGHMEDMVTAKIPELVGRTGMTAAQARLQLETRLVKLRRWQV